MTKRVSLRGRRSKKSKRALKSPQKELRSEPAAPVRDLRAVARILAIDDDGAMLSIIRKLLEREKFDVTTANGGQEGMNAFNRTSFDLVLLDIDMPEVSGFEVLRHIRSRSSDVKVIMVTGLDDLEHGIQSMDSGANGYITKPFGVGDFIHEVKRILED